MDPWITFLCIFMSILEKYFSIQIWWQTKIFPGNTSVLWIWNILTIFKAKRNAISENWQITSRFNEFKKCHDFCKFNLFLSEIKNTNGSEKMTELQIILKVKCFYPILIWWPSRSWNCRCILIFTEKIQHKQFVYRWCLDNLYFKNMFLFL